MGNILESSSESEKEDTNTNSKFDVEAIRTSADGMESETNVVLKPGSGGVDQVERVTRSLGFPLGVGDNPRIRFDGTSEIPDDKKWCSGLPMKLSGIVAESPKQKLQISKKSPKELPPLDKLIVLKPTKSPSDSTSNNNTAFNKMVSHPGKQKEPKFVPYEPYKGATRSMTEEDSSISVHSRKPSGSSTTSTASSVHAVVDVKRVPSTSKIAESASNVIKVQDISQTMDLELSGHSVLLLKERLKIHEKDINELRVENSRLKTMLVDSLSGTPATANHVSQTTRSKLRLEGTGEHSSVSESFDNLTDEISVWRSKFLSTCVLVEQLTKQNQDLKARVTGATELFREMKQSSDVVLNPLFFDKINSWIHQSVNYKHDTMFNGTVSALNISIGDDSDPVLS